MERLSKNFIWMAAANVVSGIFTTTIFVYLARTLEPEAFGNLSYAYTFVFYLVNFVDLGLSTYGIREVSKDRSCLKKYVSEIVSFKFLMALVIYLLFVSIALFTPLSNILKILIAESCLILFISALSTEWAFQGVEKMHMVFVSFAATAILQLMLILSFIKGPNDVFKVPILYFIAGIPIIILFLNRLDFRFLLKAADLKNISSYLSASLIIWLISIFTQIYNGLDIIMLGFFKSLREVGYFTIARRMIGGAGFILLFMANAVLPRLSCTFSTDIAQFNHATKRFLKLALVLAIAVFLPAIIFSKELISLTVGSDYLPARFPFSIMLGTLILILFNLPFSTGLIAACFEKEVLKQSAACACFNIVSNLILIPKYGMIGAAFSFLLTEALALIWILRLYKKNIGKKSIL